MKSIKSLKKGIFFVIEGIDGAGKSTQADLLKEWLTALGYNVVITKEPTEDSFHGLKIRLNMCSDTRFSPQEELYLFMEDRKYHLERFIIPALDEKKIVICDRYYYSNMAYQGAVGIDPDEIRRINEAFAVIPDAVFYLKMDVKEGLHRIENVRNSKLTSFEKESFLQKVSGIFDNMDFDYFHTIDASKDEETVSKKIIGIVKKIMSSHEG
jgi:dTMP kinase